MAPTFLAFYNAAGESSHVLLPKAIPYATTHLPDDCAETIDLSVFQNSTHSIARIRIFDDYLLLSALPDAPCKICVQTSSGKEIQVPASTLAETVWFVLEDGTQFTYGTVRCSVEFDYDNSISNSMRPPQLPYAVQNTSTFDDEDMLQENDTPAEPTRNVLASANRPEITKQPPDGTDNPSSHNSKQVQASIATIEPCSITNIAAVTESIERDDVHLTLPRTTQPQATENNQSSEVPTSSLKSESSEDPIALLTKSTARNGTTIPLINPQPPIGSFFRSNIRKITQLIKPSSTSDSQTPTGQRHDKHENLHESSNTNNRSTASIFARKPGEGSQPLPQPSVTSTYFESRQESFDLLDVQTTRNDSHKRFLGDGSHVLEAQVLLKDIEKRGKETLKNQRVPLSNLQNGSAPSHQPSKNTEKRAVSFATPPPPYSSEKKIPAVAKDLLLKKQQKQVLSRTTEVDMSSLSPSPLSHSNLKRPSLSETETEETESDNTAVNDSERKAKRRRILRSEDWSGDLLTEPMVIFSSACEIQNKKKTLQSFIELGAKITKNVFRADILCVPTSGELKKTSKLILAIVLGRRIVTEDWVRDCARRGRILGTGRYLPSDPLREAEWRFNLSDAVVRGRDPRSGLTKLFEGYNIYLTSQLRDQLEGTKNLEDFVKICKAMGAANIRMRIPVKYGLRMICLGVRNDFDASAVRNLGFQLYDKDLLTMSALRGKRLDISDEFKYDKPIKAEVKE